ncbi:alpha/beta fold hydrolase [Nocardia sp. 004]|uniref:alpha/beta fold hydrolase n=1 Tax=Nocardia sp. 004 TaxID=3385978 RepID=UPI0039A2D6C7
MPTHEPTTPHARRPSWVPEQLYPFTDHYLELDGSTVHYIDEGAGPPLLMLHGNPTWSFLYRNLVIGLRDRYRCLAVDYPGFGLSTAAPGYRFTPAEHADLIGQLIQRLDLREITLMVQDWGGPIGFATATRHPDRFSAFVIGNTWAWPKSDLGTQAFARFLGGPVGGRLIRQHNFFVERIIPAGVRRTKLDDTVMNAYRGPFPTPSSREPVYVFPREILASRDLLADIERTLPAVTDRPALIVWGTKDVAFRAAERRRWEQLFSRHRTVPLIGAGHYIQEDAPDEIITAIRSWAAI